MSRVVTVMYKLALLATTMFDAQRTDDAGPLFRRIMEEAALAVSTRLLHSLSLIDLRCATTSQRQLSVGSPTMPGLIELGPSFAARIPGFRGMSRHSIFQLTRAAGFGLRQQGVGSGSPSSRTAQNDDRSRTARETSSIILHKMEFESGGLRAGFSPDPEDVQFYDPRIRTVHAVVTFGTGPNQAALTYSRLQQEIVARSASLSNGSVAYWHSDASGVLSRYSLHTEPYCRTGEEDILPRWLEIDPEADLGLTDVEVEEEAKSLAHIVFDCSNALDANVPVSTMGGWSDHESGSDSAVVFYYKGLI